MASASLSCPRGTDTWVRVQAYHSYARLYSVMLSCSLLFMCVVSSCIAHYCRNYLPHNVSLLRGTKRISQLLVARCCALLPVPAGRFDKGVLSGVGVYFHPNGNRYAATLGMFLQ